MMHLVVQFTLTVYQDTEKVQKLKKILYWFIISFFHHSYKPFFLSLCGLTFFRLSCPLQVPHPLHWTIKVGQSWYRRSSLTRYRLPDSQESPVWKSNSNRRKACRGQRYISQSANCPNSLVNILALYHIQGCQ